MMNPGEFWGHVMYLCALYSCSVTSGPRTTRRNTSVGGAGQSRHLLSMGGLAADLVPDENTIERRAEIATAARALGLWTLDEGDHLHVDGR